MDASKPRILRDWLTQRRQYELLYAVEIDWDSRGTVRYIRFDQTAGTGEAAFLISCSGVADSLTIRNDGTYSQSIGTREMRFSEGFGLHISTEEPVGRACRVYLYPRGEISRRVLVAQGLLDESGEPYDPAFRSYGLTLLSPLYILQNKLVPQYVINRTDTPNSPDDAAGRPLPVVFGTVANHPLMLIQDWPDGELAGSITQTETASMLLADGSTWPGATVYSGTLGGDMPLAGAGSAGPIQLLGISAGRPRQGILRIGTEFVGYGNLEYLGPATAEINPLLRGWGGTTQAFHAAGASFQWANVAVIEGNTPNQELIGFDSRAGDTLSGLTRGLFAAALSHDEGSPLVALTGIPIIHAAAGHECYSLENADIRERVSGGDRPQKVYYPMTADAADTSAISGQTITSLRVEFPHLLQVHAGFNDAAQEPIDYGSGAALPFKNYAFFSYSRRILAGIWADEDWATNQDVTDCAVTAESPNEAWSEFFFTAPPAGFTQVLAFVFASSNESAQTLTCRFDAMFDGTNKQSAGFTLAGPDARTPTLSYLDVTGVGDWTGVVGSIRMILIVPANVPSLTWNIYEIGLVAIYGGAGAFAWTDTEKAINSDITDYAIYASLSPAQADIISFPFAFTDTASNLAGAQLEIRHSEPGSAAGDWTLRHARIRLGTTGELCGGWVEIPLRGAETLDTISLPVPTGDYSAAEIGYIEIVTMAAMGITMRIYATHVICWMDSITDATVTVSARDLLTRTISGAVDGAGALIEQPSDAVQWFLENEAGLLTSWIDADSFAEAKTSETASGWKVNGVLQRQEPVSAALQRLSIASAGLPVFDGQSFKFWRWPTSSAGCNWQFVHNPLGSANVVNGSVSYRRFGLADIVSLCTVNYAPRGFSSERFLVRNTAGRRPPAGGGDSVFTDRSGRLDLPFVLSAQTVPALDEWTFGRYGDIPDRIIDAELCGDATSAALIAEAARNIFSRKRWIVTFTVGPWGELVDLGALAEFCDADLPANVIQGFRRNGWWDGIQWGDAWPDSLRGFHIVIMGRNQNDDGSWTFTAWEWCDSTFPSRG